MTPPIKRGTACRLGLRLPQHFPYYRQRVVIGFDPAGDMKDFVMATTRGYYLMDPANVDSMRDDLLRIFKEANSQAGAGLLATTPPTPPIERLTLINALGLAHACGLLQKDYDPFAAADALLDGTAPTPDQLAGIASPDVSPVGVDVQSPTEKEGGPQ